MGADFTGYGRRLCMVSAVRKQQFDLVSDFSVWIYHDLFRCIALCRQMNITPAGNKPAGVSK